MNKKHEKIKTFLKNSLLFFLASFIPRCISFFLVPLYTSCLSTAEYGTIDLINVTIQLALPLFTLQIQDAILRFAMDPNEEPERVFSASMRIITIGYLALLVVGMLSWACGLVQINWQYMAYFFASYLVTALYNAFTYFLRAIDKVKYITVASILSSVITISSNLLFLLVLRWGVYGYLISSVLGHLFANVFMFASAKLNKSLRTTTADRDLARRIIIFSLPMIASALSWWVNNSLDKYILTYFCGISAAGILAVAYKIPTILSTLGSILARSSSISVIENFDAEDRDGFLGENYSAVGFLMVIMASGLMLINIPLSKLLFSNEFYVAWKLVPPLLVATVMNQLSLYCESIFVALKKTSIISITAIAGGTLNIILNCSLIPPFGAYGAVIATAISYFAVWLLRYLLVTKTVKLKNNILKEAISYILLVGQLICAYSGNQYIILQIVILVAIILLYASETIRALRKMVSHIRA